VDGLKKGRHRRQLTVFGILLGINALLAALTYLVFPIDQLTLGQGAPATMPDVPPWVVGLANAGIVLVLYGLLGLAGYWIARRGLGLPGIYREKVGWDSWFAAPMLIGFAVGVAVILVDRLFAGLDPAWEGFTHPGFPLSIIASATAGIGEEILFRLFVMSLWAYLLNLALGRFGMRSVALWGGNLIGALAFAAGHLPAAMVLVGAATPGEIPPVVLAELLVLNGVMGLAAGWQFMRTGLVAAVGVHFWADIIWHVLWPLL
jgi:hypothetical protein